jgi:hypothetical protein
MSTLYTESEQETEERNHRDEDIDESRMEEYLRERGLQRNAETGAIEEIPAAVNSKTIKRVEICSCGSHMCCMIVVYGLPVPTFQEHIEPLYPQSARDVHALEIRGSL